ncbi:phage tail protein [Flavisphingomonas formosensis]|uniref:phage tail protein n=1 Tax=Flavisphingomonas formosensis TaxID=861534 RepID=UPI0018DFD3E2|nr:phage tail protein [Sphingomonas formosensis]
MIKPDSLRAALAAVFPDLVRDPERCKLFIDKGRIAARFPPPGQPPVWEYRYRLNLRVFDYTDHPDRLILPILAWLTVHQPELLLNHASGDQALPFEADIIDDHTIDISIDLELTEAVRAQPRGGWRL